MALTFNVRELPPHLTTAAFLAESREQWHPVLHTLLHLSLVCGFSSITEKNYKKVWKRVAEYETIVGPLLSYYSTDVNPHYLSPGDIKAFVGLRTNVNALSDAGWRKKLYLIVSGSVETRNDPDTPVILQDYEEYVRAHVQNNLTISDPWKPLLMETTQ